MNKKVIYRAGIVPYIIRNDGEIDMLFMKPSDIIYGGDCFQIAKGKRDDDDLSDYVTALREGSEELGLKESNIIDSIDLGNHLGRTRIFLVEVKDKADFNVPHFETEETRWMTCSEFSLIGRDIHVPIVEKIKSKILDRIAQQQHL